MEKTMENVKKFDRDAFRDDYGQSLIFLDVKYDNAIIGVSVTGNVVYNAMYLVELLMLDDHTISWTEAMEHHYPNLLIDAKISDGINKQPILIDLN